MRAGATTGALPGVLTGGTGEWVSERFGIRLDTVTPAAGAPLTDVVGLALRRNPRRAHLLVSRVLGKHVPADPHRVIDAGLRLGRAVRSVLGDRPALVLGYAETATALGHLVADVLAAPYLHSTRRAVPGVPALAGFAEEHSHAVDHLLLPRDTAMFDNDDPLVLVDDEISSGSTARNTISALHALRPRSRYVIAALVDVRCDTDRGRMAATAAALGTTIEVVAPAVGRIAVPSDVARRVREMTAATGTVTTGPDVAAATGPDVRGGRRRAPRTAGRIERVTVPWPPDLPETGRHGFGPADRRRLDGALAPVVTRLERAVRGTRRVHVLGVEEFMYVPLRIAAGLRDALLPYGGEVVFSTTTRSPVVAVDHCRYPIRRALTFDAHDGVPGAAAGDSTHGAGDGAPAAGGDGRRFAYNIGRSPGAILLLLDPASDTGALSRPGGLLTALAPVADRVVVATIGARR